MDKVKGRLTLLVDNIVSGKAESLGEDGFSVFVETDYGNFLFDTGRGTTIVHNSIVHKKNLGLLNKIILSHGHADHSGGLEQVLRFHDKIKVLGHPDIFLNRFRGVEGGNQKYGGIPYNMSYLEKLGASFVFNREFVDIDQGLYLTGEIPRETDFEYGDMANRWGIRDGKIIQDIILDDQSLIIGTEQGILILLGCAHSGIINIINHSMKMTGSDRIWGIIGGTHLGFSGEVQLEKTIQALKYYQIEHFIPAHCTGIDAVSRLVNVFKEVVRFSYAGMTFEF